MASCVEPGLIVFVGVDEDCWGGNADAGQNSNEWERRDGGAPVSVGFEAKWDGEEAEVEDAVYEGDVQRHTDELEMCESVLRKRQNAWMAYHRLSRHHFHGPGEVLLHEIHVRSGVWYRQPESFRLSFDQFWLIRFRDNKKSK